MKNKPSLTVLCYCVASLCLLASAVLNLCNSAWVTAIAQFYLAFLMALMAALSKKRQQKDQANKQNGCSLAAAAAKKNSERSEP